MSVFYKGDAAPPGRGPAGRPVEVLSYRGEEDLARLMARVIENLQAEEVPLKDMVVLTPSAPTMSALRRRGRVNGYRLSEHPEAGAVLTSSVHEFQGLERPVVILAGLGDGHEEHLDQYLYVGGSRARNHLIVLATEPVAKRLRALAGVARP